MNLFERLVDDAAMFPPGNLSAADAVAEHRRHRAAWYASMIGPLVVPDDRLPEVGRLAGTFGEPLQVSVVTSAGAGGVVALARRLNTGRIDPALGVVAVEAALRDLDDLPGNARRVCRAADGLPDDVRVFVEVPDAPAFAAALDEIESGGRYGKIRTGGVTPDRYPSAARLAEQLAALVEADLPFKATAGLHHAWPTTVPSPAGELHQHGFGNLLVALEALIEGATTAAATDLLSDPDPEPLRALGAWTDAQVQRVRRQFCGFGCCGVEEPVADLVTLGLLAPE